MRFGTRCFQGGGIRLPSRIANQAFYATFGGSNCRGEGLSALSAGMAAVPSPCRPLNHLLPYAAVISAGRQPLGFSHSHRWPRANATKEISV